MAAGAGVMSILSNEERSRLDNRLKQLAWGKLLLANNRDKLVAEFETVVQEACARLMDDLSHADPLNGPVWSICKSGASRIRKHRSDQ